MKHKSLLLCSLGILLQQCAPNPLPAASEEVNSDGSHNANDPSMPSHFTHKRRSDPGQSVIAPSQAAPVSPSDASLWSVADTSDGTKNHHRNQKREPVGENPYDKEVYRTRTEAEKEQEKQRMREIFPNASPNAWFNLGNDASNVQQTNPNPNPSNQQTGGFVNPAPPKRMTMEQKARQEKERQALEQARQEQERQAQQKKQQQTQRVGMRPWDPNTDQGVSQSTQSSSKQGSQLNQLDSSDFRNTVTFSRAPLSAYKRDERIRKAAKSGEQQQQQQAGGQGQQQDEDDGLDQRTRQWIESLEPPKYPGNANQMAKQESNWRKIMGKSIKDQFGGEALARFQANQVEQISRRRESVLAEEEAAQKPDPSKQESGGWDFNISNMDFENRNPGGLGTITEEMSSQLSKATLGAKDPMKGASSRKKYRIVKLGDPNDDTNQVQSSVGPGENPSKMGIGSGAGGQEIKVEGWPGDGQGGGEGGTESQSTQPQRRRTTKEERIVNGAQRDADFKWILQTYGIDAAQTYWDSVQPNIAREREDADNEWREEQKKVPLTEDWGSIPDANEYERHRLRVRTSKNTVPQQALNQADEQEFAQRIQNLKFESDVQEQQPESAEYFVDGKRRWGFWDKGKFYEDYE
ncbi:MAG: hypothetical protein M1831_003851 [Alyxoria varia]|nr:MAG: hypothetical protein M1831_003851 [Alyxoria varia]